MDDAEAARRVEAVRSMVRRRGLDVERGGASEIQRDLSAMVHALHHAECALRIQEKSAATWGNAMSRICDALGVHGSGHADNLAERCIAVIGRLRAKVKAADAFRDDVLGRVPGKHVARVVDRDRGEWLVRNVTGPLSRGDYPSWVDRVASGVVMDQNVALTEEHLAPVRAAVLEVHLTARDRAVGMVER